MDAIEHSSICSFLLMVLNCKLAMLVLRHFIFAQLLQNGGFVVFVFLSNACFNMLDTMHCVAIVL